MISLNDTLLFKSLIGNKITLIGSSAMHIYDGEITSQEMNMCITINSKYILFNCDYKTGFFENEDGEVFYDFNIFDNNTESKYQKSSVSYLTSEITQISIYGRKFNGSEFINYPELYAKIKNEVKTDDVFVFNFKNTSQIILLFHPFLPSVTLYFKQKEIEEFWREYGYKYMQHYAIN